MTSRHTGRLTQWDDAKGYGFITPDGAGPTSRLFVHIKAFGLRPRRPFVGERVSFVSGQDAQGKPRALQVRSLEPRPVPPAPPPRDRSRVLWLVPGFAAFVLACHLAWGLPNAVWTVYSAMSMATFFVYWGDKRAARLGGSRVAEGTLHALALAGGWPGALLAQEQLRHKSVKPAFRRIFWATVLINLIAFVAVFTPLIKGLVGR